VLEKFAPLGRSLTSWRQLRAVLLLCALTLGLVAGPLALPAHAEGTASTFVVEYKALLREAYPPGRHGTDLPFRRVFVVGRLPEDQA